MPFLTQPLSRVIGIALLLILLFVPVSIPVRLVALACAALVWIRLEAGSLEPIGLGRKRVGSTLLWGIGIFIGVTILGEVSEPVFEHLFDLRPDYTGYGALVGNAPLALRLLAFALISASIGEEILFRGFLLHQLTSLLSSDKIARWSAISAGGAIFGVAHFIQGPLGMINTGIVGVIFGWAWLRSDRNLWALILAHALTDSYGIGMLYLGRHT
jgi:membrane protease YdiL (CAAX protease family)